MICDIKRFIRNRFESFSSIRETNKKWMAYHHKMWWPALHDFCILCDIAQLTFFLSPLRLTITDVHWSKWKNGLSNKNQPNIFCYVFTIMRNDFKRRWDKGSFMRNSILQYWKNFLIVAPNVEKKRLMLPLRIIILQIEKKRLVLHFLFFFW